MAQIGKLGDITFEVSDEVVLTVSNMSWSGSSRYAVHERHMYDAMSELTGSDADQISLDIVLSQNLGVNPQEELTKLWRYMRSGKTLPLAIGSKGYGKYRWTITRLNIKLQNFDGIGNVIRAVVTVNLQEYLWW